MSDVTFNEPQYDQERSSRATKRPSTLTSLFISLGLAKDEPSAQRAMLITTVVIAVLAIAIYVYGKLA
jgi:Na+/pantothenate symporter